MESAQPFASGSKILHIGPPKTATSSLQGAMHTSRDRLAEHGVVYAGRVRHSRGAATAAVFERVPPGRPTKILTRWQRLSGEVRTSEARVTVLSSETFSAAGDGAAERIVAAIGGPVRVVMTIRPLAHMLSSSWQQRVRMRHTMVDDYDTWLRGLFTLDASGDPTSSYWDRHGIDRLVARWGGIVGNENVTVVVLDPSDRGMLLRTFDELLGLPQDTLQADPHTQNLSVPYPQTEMLRHFNKLYLDSGRPRDEWLDIVAKGVMSQVQHTDRFGFPPYRIETPRWAAVAANGLCDRWERTLSGLPVEVAGDLAHLRVDPDEYKVNPPRPTELSAESAAQIAFLTYVAAQESGSSTGDEATEATEATPPPAATTPARGGKSRWQRLIRRVIGRRRSR